jgi:hypothetical protein
MRWNGKELMTPEIFAEWLKRQGHQVIRTETSYWFNQGPRVYQAFPYHWVIQPSEEELKHFLKENNALGLRYSTPIDSVKGCESYHAVYENESYDYDNLSKWARKNVRRGLNHCSVESITFERLANEGWNLQLDTLDRQGRKLPIEKGEWQNRCISAGELPGFEAWGAIDKGKLAASVITFQMVDCCYMLYQQCLRDYLADHVNNALGFIVTKEMINRPSIKSILYGLHSLDAPASVDEFKFRMGYSAKPVKQRVEFHPMLAPLFNPISYKIIKQLKSWKPSNPSLAKMEGMVRFYLEGKSHHS